MIWSFGEKKKKTTGKSNSLHYKSILFLHSEYSFCWQYMGILYGLRMRRKQTFLIWWGSTQTFSFFFFTRKCWKLLNKPVIAHTLFFCHLQWMTASGVEIQNPLRFWGDSGASIQHFQTLYTSATRAGIYNIADSLVSLAFRAQISLTGCGYFDADVNMCYHFSHFLWNTRDYGDIFGIIASFQECWLSKWA